MSERTPQDVLRELKKAVDAELQHQLRKAPFTRSSGYESGLSFAIREIDIALDKAIAEAPDSPLQGGRWTTERRPEDDAECERLGCEDRTHPVHHWAPDTLSEKPGLDAVAAQTRDLLANYLWNEDDSGDENDLVAAYDHLRDILGPSTETDVGATLANESGSTDSEGR